MKLTICILLGLVGYGAAAAASGLANLEIAAFNIQVFGPTKAGKPWVMDRIVDILTRYDNTCVQEIRDASITVPYQLLELLNERQHNQWEMVLSERQGRTSSKEQVAFYYRHHQMTPGQTFQYPDYRDIYERPPFTVEFETHGRNVGTFSFLCTHVKPTDAVSEIDHLAEIYDITVAQLDHNPNMILGGDFNAGCSYVRQSDWENIRLRTDNRFYWAIPDDANTNVSLNTECAYDRLVLAGNNLQGSYVQDSAGVFDFRAYYGLTQEETLEVSDHFPVYLSLH